MYGWMFSCFNNIPKIPYIFQPFRASDLERMCGGLIKDVTQFGVCVCVCVYRQGKASLFI